MQMAVAFLRTWVQNQDIDDYKKLTRTMRYLRAGVALKADKLNDFVGGYILFSTPQNAKPFRIDVVFGWRDYLWVIQNRSLKQEAQPELN